MQDDQHCSAKEQGNDREQDSGANIACPMRIGRKAQISHSSYVADAQQGPKQNHSGDQNGAMKERFKIVSRQKGQHAVRRERLGRPEQYWSKERSNDDDRDKVGC